MPPYKSYVMLRRILFVTTLVKRGPESRGKLRTISQTSVHLRKLSGIAYVYRLAIPTAPRDLNRRKVKIVLSLSQTTNFSWLYWGLSPL